MLERCEIFKIINDKNVVLEKINVVPCLLHTGAHWVCFGQSAWVRGKLVAIVPRHPVIRMFSEVRRIQLQLIQVVERICTVELASINQAHKDVTDVGAIVSLVEHGILAVKDGLLECPFTNIVVQRRARLTQEQRHRLPTLEQVVDRLSHGRVGLDQLLIELAL